VGMSLAAILCGCAQFELTSREQKCAVGMCPCDCMRVGMRIDFPRTWGCDADRFAPPWVRCKFPVSAGMWLNIPAEQA
jgi:hypothetical protein